MKKSAKFVAMLFLVMGWAAVCQIALPEPALNSQPVSTAAYVYVSTNPGGNTYQINGYSASSTGMLTEIPGSPFSTNGVSYMALNSKWLFGDNGTYIYSFSIASNGALKEVSSINAAEYNSSGTGGPEQLFLDHTGANLYDFDIYAGGTGNNGYQSFDISQNSGVLSYTGTTSSSAYFETPLSFIGNNKYAYGGSCYHGDPSIYGFSRSASGMLTDLNLNPPLPTAPSGITYCPYLAAADTTNDVALSMTPTNDITPVGPTQLAVYTADSSGNLTTSSTDKNMPQVAVGNVNDIWASPDGKGLAVAGSGGLQVFHFNGANPITHGTGLLTKAPVTQVFWDNLDHLYAISPSAGQLFVFIVTENGVTQAPGSPYSVPGAENIIVLPQ